MRRETRRKWVSGTLGREGPGSFRLFSRVMACTATNEIKPIKSCIIELSNVEIQKKLEIQFKIVAPFFQINFKLLLSPSIKINYHTIIKNIYIYLLFWKINSILMIFITSMFLSLKRDNLIMVENNRLQFLR